MNQTIQINLQVKLIKELRLIQALTESYFSVSFTFIKNIAKPKIALNKI